MSRPLRAYLAGPMRGYADFNFPAFFEAEERLTLAGLAVFNPARKDTDDGFDFSGTTGTLDDMKERGFSLRLALAADLDFIAKEADMVVLLPGWEASKGAQAEVATAHALGLMVWEYDPDVVLSLGEWLVASIEQMKGSLPDLDLDESTRAFLDAHGKIVEPDEPRDTVAHENLGGLFDDPAPDWNPADPGGLMAHMAAHGDSVAAGGDLRASERVSGSEYRVDPARLSDGGTSAPSGEVRTTSLTGGEKGDKPARFDLIPALPLWHLAELYGAGARKYADRNWEKGYAWHLSFAAMMRHAWLFWQGEDLDDETGSPHLASVVFHAFAMLEWASTHPEYDDRPHTAKE